MKRKDTCDWIYRRYHFHLCVYRLTQQYGAFAFFPKRFLLQPNLQPSAFFQILRAIMPGDKGHNGRAGGHPGKEGCQFLAYIGRLVACPGK